MDKQQEQMTQNQNQEVEYISTFRDEDEELNESEFDEPTREQGKVDNLTENQQNKLEEEEEQPKKPKRPRKTIEQEIAELDAKRERLVEKKRRQDAHEKIVFGAITIKALKRAIISTNRRMAAGKIIEAIIEASNEKDKDVIEKIIKEIREASN